MALARAVTAPARAATAPARAVIALAGAVTALVRATAALARGARAGPAADPDEHPPPASITDGILHMSSMAVKYLS
jgi:hypothetical protein